MNFYTLISKGNFSAVSHVKLFFVGVTISIFSLAAFSAVVDPEEIYLKKYAMQENVVDYVESMINSDNGVLSSGPERLVKLTLADYSEADCFVIGSSRSMQASLRSESWISEKCSSLANLGVSGGSLEDIIIYSSVIADKKNKEILMFVDPWALSFNADVRWRENSEVFYSQMRSYGLGGSAYQPFDFDRFFNLINYEYITASFELLRNEGFDALPYLDKSDVSYAPDFDYSTGHEKTVRLPDGSLVYSSEYISGAMSREINNGGYKIGSVGVSEEALDAFENTIESLRSSGHSLTFIFPPYHPHVFSSDGDPVVVEKITAVEARLLDIAKSENIEVIGSYNSERYGCTEEEFYDAIHPSFTCLSKLEPR